MSRIPLKRKCTDLWRHWSLNCWSVTGSFSSGRRDQSHKPVHTRDQANFEGASLCNWFYDSVTNFGDHNAVPVTRFLTKIGPFSEGLGPQDQSLQPVPSCCDFYFKEWQCRTNSLNICLEFTQLIMLQQERFKEAPRIQSLLLVFYMISLSKTNTNKVENLKIPLV